MGRRRTRILKSNKHKPEDKNEENLGKSLEQQIENHGSPHCGHLRVYYFDGLLYHIGGRQDWWCDDCSRHEKLEYSLNSEATMKFPENALIRIQDPRYGGGEFYVLRASSGGVLEHLSRDEWVRRIKVLEKTHGQ